MATTTQTFAGTSTGAAALTLAGQSTPASAPLVKSFISKPGRRGSTGAGHKVSLGGPGGPGGGGFPGFPGLGFPGGGFPGGGAPGGGGGPPGGGPPGGGGPAGGGGDKLGGNCYVLAGTHTAQREHEVSVGSRVQWFNGSMVQMRSQRPSMDRG